MRFMDVNSRDWAERVYVFLSSNFMELFHSSIPYLRRVQRFIFLPYCYFFLVNWDRCPVSRWKVFLDFMYIFFILKDFPDNYYPCKLWEKPRREWAYYFGSNYNPWQRAKLRRYVQRKDFEVIYEDKSLFYDICTSKGIRVPRCLDTFNGDFFSFSDIENIFLKYPEHNRIILKPSGGKGGHSIYVLKRNDDFSIEIIYPTLSATTIMNDLSGDYLVQEFIDQHGSLSEFSEATNTIRIVTMCTQSGDVIVLGAYLRIGTGDSLIDNLSKGGVAVPIDLDTGNLTCEGVDRRGQSYSEHPQSGKIFEGFSIPFWDKVVSLSKSAQTDLGYQKLLGMDIAICIDGPMLIEVNSIYDNIDFEQMCGPVLAKRDVWDEYKRYNLLYNRKQTSLYHRDDQGV